jgi:hypothetical protein
LCPSSRPDRALWAISALGTLDSSRACGQGRIARRERTLRSRATVVPADGLVARVRPLVFHVGNDHGPLIDHHVLAFIRVEVDVAKQRLCAKRRGAQCHRYRQRQLPTVGFHNQAV